MAKDKERSINPAQQQRKLDKAKALKKGKAEVQARRNEKLARQNPNRLQRQVDDLKALEESGQIKPREKQILEGLERDIRAVKKAREALGDKAPQFKKPREHDASRLQDDSNILGKRRHDGERKYPPNYQKEDSSSEETDESVRKIPMPRDTPPPILHQFRHNHHVRNANHEPLASCRLPDLPLAVPSKPLQPVTTYSSAPQIRDLKREAISKFVPNVVRKKQEAVTGKVGLIEPEELDRLEAEGYTSKKSTADPTNTGVDTAAEDEGLGGIRRLKEEEERFMIEVASNDGLGLAEIVNQAEHAPAALEAQSMQDLGLLHAAVGVVSNVPAAASQSQPGLAETENLAEPAPPTEEATSLKEDLAMHDAAVQAAPTIPDILARPTTEPVFAGLVGYDSDEDEANEKEPTAVPARSRHVEIEEVEDEDA